ncbi:EamA family transporter [Flavobacterium magnum]|uniref:EamA family transporter n=1 Tax=Flavobacterium magnum TaxID=2162713 RepID=A0A2S0RBP6_9FLAO|nr:DMT family transporter [Flavobacterium magnum]AWA29133.1 EamA family transporter [Flavobacterium magnum]
MSKRTAALIAATLVSLIYGVTFTVAKDVMPAYIDAFGFITLRVGGSVLLFWGVWLFMPKEKIAWRDFPRIVAAAFFGVALNMLTFFKGLSYTTPISAAVIMVTTPIIVLILSAIMMKERMRKRKVFGILLGLGGTASLIYFGNHNPAHLATNGTLGNLLVFINAVSYAFYLIVVRKLMDRYSAFTFVKWVYLFGFLMVLPFGWDEFRAIRWEAMPESIYWKVGFVLVFSTFLTYLLNLLSMKTLKPVTVAVFIYLQPLFATVIAIGLGKDTLSPVKIISAVFIFSGVYLVTQKQPEPTGEAAAEA